MTKDYKVRYTNSRFSDQKVGRNVPRKCRPVGGVKGHNIKWDDPAGKPRRMAGEVHLDGKSFIQCEFGNCIILLEQGDTEISGCSFKDGKLMLKGNAYTVGRIIKLFTGKSPLKVLDMEQPLFEKGSE